MAVTPQKMSLAEFLKLPEIKPARELRNGVVSQKMAPSMPHSSIQGWFVSRVEWLGESGDIARAFPEARLLLGDETYVPDIVVFRWDRIPEDEHGDLPRYVTSLPDLIVEILSPGQTVRGQLDRCREYIAHGVPVVMFADPDRRTVHVLRADHEIGPLRDSDPIAITDVLPGFELTVSDLFSRIRARPSRRRS